MMAQNEQIDVVKMQENLERGVEAKRLSAPTTTCTYGCCGEVEEVEFKISNSAATHFSALTLLFGRQEAHPDFKKLSGGLQPRIRSECFFLALAYPGCPGYVGCGCRCHRYWHQRLVVVGELV